MAEPFGFKPVKSLSGKAVSVNYYTYASNASRIFKGDLVKLNSSGLVDRLTNSATATGPYLGVAMQDTGTISAQGTIPICDDPEAIFEAVSTAAIAQTGLNLNYNASVAAGDTATGLSASKLGAALSATSILGVKVLRLSRQVGNTINTAKQVLECQINNHAFRSGTQGI